MYTETYRDCERCSRGCSTVEDSERQSTERCTVNVGARRRWREPGHGLIVHMGLSPDDPRLEPEPPEDNDEGCPGGWYRTPYFSSVSRYLRPVAEGVYSPNLLLDRCDDRLVIEAVTYYEQQQSRHRRWASELTNRQLAARAKRR